MHSALGATHPWAIVRVYQPEHSMWRYNVHTFLLADSFTDSTVVSYNVRNAVQSQPSLLFKVEGGDYKDLRSRGRVLLSRGSYIIGYRECVSNPSQMYYISHPDVSMEFCGFSINGAGGNY